MNDVCLNVHAIEENLLLKVIDKIENPEEKQKALEEYIRIAKEIYQPKMQRNHQEKFQLYFLKEILKRIESEGSSKKPTISDLTREINETKKELKVLKTRVQVLEHVNLQELSCQHSKKEDDDQELSKLLDKTQSTTLCRINKNSGGSKSRTVAEFKMSYFITF